MLSNGQIEKILAEARKSGADFAELYLEDRNDTILKCVDRKVNGVTGLHIHGAGLYVLDGINRVYVYDNDTSYAALMKVAEKASVLIASGMRCPEGGPV